MKKKMAEFGFALLIGLIILGSIKDRKFNSNAKTCQERIDTAKICHEKICTIKQRGEHEQSNSKGRGQQTKNFS